MKRPLWSRPWPKVGDPIEVGCDVALLIEPEERWARVVGVVKNVDRFMWILRMYSNKSEEFPTGEYRRGNAGISFCAIEESEHAWRVRYGMTLYEGMEDADERVS